MDCDTSLAADGDGGGIGEPRASIDTTPTDPPDGATHPPDSTPFLGIAFTDDLSMTQQRARIAAGSEAAAARRMSIDDFVHLGRENMGE